MKTVQILLLHNKLSKDTSFVGKVIAFWTRSKYYHTEIMINGYRVISVPGNGLVIDKSLPHDIDNWDIVKVPKFSVTTSEYEEIFTWLSEQVGKDYDIKGILFSQIFKWNTHNPDKWFCSEIATTILQLFNIPRSEGLIPNNVSPAILGNIFNPGDI